MGVTDLVHIFCNPYARLFLKDRKLRLIYSYPILPQVWFDRKLTSGLIGITTFHGITEWITRLAEEIVFVIE